MGVFSYLCQPQQAPPSAPTWEPHNKRRRHQDGHDSNPDSDLRSLCQQMGRLLLRQEDVLNSLCQDHSYTCFMSRMTHGVLPQILDKTKQWHQAHKQNEATLTLRASLCHVLFEQMRQRLNDILSAKKGEAVWKGAIQSHLITEDMMIPDLQWDHKQKKLIPKLNSGRPYTEILQMLHQLQQLCIKEGVIQKLHALQNTNSQTSMETAGEPETRPLNAADLGSAPVERHLAVHSMPNATMEPTAQHLSAIDPEKLARESIMAAILQLRCLNERNQCWMNANVLAWLWSVCQAKDVDWGDYGTGANEVSALLTQNSAGGINLLDWGFNPRNWDAQYQRDSAEYTADVLNHYEPPRVDMSWEKLIMVRATLEVLETNESKVPVFLRLGESPTSLQQLIDCWSADENAVAGFLYDSVYKVFQLDRVSYDSQGKPQKLKTSLHVEPQVHLPCFVDTTNTTYQILSYDVVAVVYHSGTANGGHLQAGLRAGPPTQWHCTDDGRVATYHPTLLREVAKDLVQIWLVKSTSLGCAIPRPPNNGFTTMVQQIALKMQDKAYADIYKNEVLREQLATRCVICGQWIFRYRDAIHHLMEHHPQAEVKWTLYRRLHDAIPCSPCRWCSAWNVERHNCLPLLQAVLTLHLNMTEEPYTVPLRTPKRRKSADSATPAAPSLAQHLEMTMHNMEFSESGSLAAPPKIPQAPALLALVLSADAWILERPLLILGSCHYKNLRIQTGEPPLLTWRPPWRVRLLLT